MFETQLDASITSPQIWLIGIIVFILAYNYLMKEPWKKPPPGPPALPLIGSLPFLGLSSDIREPLRKMAEKYGDVFTVFLGPRRVVVLNGHDTIHEAFVKNAHVFSGRPETYLFTGVLEGYGVISTQGGLWREQRRHALHILRDFGLGRTILEDRILEEVGYFIQEMEKKIGTPFYPQPTLQKSVANVIMSVTFGKRMDYEDQRFIKYLKIFNRTIQVIGNGGVVTTFPFVRFLPGDLFGMKQLRQDFDFLNSEYQRMIDEHKEAVKEGKQTEDVITSYLKKIEEEKDVADTTFTERQLVGLCGDLFGAGTETTSTTLAWAIIYMALNQNIQDRVHAEIEDVIGCDALPRMCHRLQLPYSEACILETQRLGDIVPLGVPHSVTENVHFRGYFIPKDTMILPNMYGVHMNPKHWPEPEKFKPERFLDEEGKVSQKQLIPFSMGKRICMGEGLAKMELFLYFTVMMQRFRFTLVPDYPVPDTKGIIGITKTPELFHVMLEKRNIK